MTEEEIRLKESLEHKAHWRRWGPYVSERQWGTVREDYSTNGDAWDYFPDSHARSRAYRWGEDGLFGICDNHQRLCFALWFRNTWSWFPDSPRPRISAFESAPGSPMLRADHETLGSMWLTGDPAAECPFTENETSFERLYGIPNSSPYVKDSFQRPDDFVGRRSRATAQDPCPHVERR